LANKKSAQKRIGQNEKRRVRNLQVKSSVRTSMKRIMHVLQSKGDIKSEELVTLQKKFTKTIDTAARKNIIHWKTAARKKSRIAKKVNSAL
jgi:small subunit ribosomal protein S20